MGNGLARPLAVLVCLAVPALVAPAEAAEPFYENLLRRGVAAYQTGDHAAATRQLRIATFGLLDEPERLATGLAHLALAQLAQDDDEAFRATARRLLEIERRFGALAAAELDPALRQLLGNEIATRLPYELLADLPVFADAARGQLVARIAALEPEPRRRELRRLLAADPGHEPWTLMLAELELAGNNFPEARAALEPLLATQPEHPRARCLRGWADAELARCASALADLAFCEPAAVAGPGQLEARLRCRVAVADWEGAATLLAELPAGTRQRKPFRRLAREIERGRKQTARAAGNGDDPTTAAADDTGAAESTAAADDTAATDDTGAADATPADDATLAETGTPAGDDAPAATPPSDGGTPTDDGLGPLLTAFEAARRAADGAPDHRAVQLEVAELAYKLRRWGDVVRYLERAAPVPDERPDLLFYLAVARYETGDAAGAAVALRQSLPRLERSAFVDGYVSRILGDDSG